MNSSQHPPLQKRNLAARVYGKARSTRWRASMKGLERGPRVTRYTMYKRLEEISLDHPPGRLLSISHSARLAMVLGITATETIEANYPDVDILSLPFPKENFDFVVSDQVLEHVAGSPQQAIDECLRVLKIGGVVCHTTCFINPVHGASDFWRFTPDALRLLHHGCSEIIECDGWGNFDVLQAIRNGFRSEPVPHAPWHPLHKLAVKNDCDWPISTWIVAKK
jgi:SAM-dependent methyltransferase